MMKIKIFMLQFSNNYSKRVHVGTKQWKLWCEATKLQYACEVWKSSAYYLQRYSPFYECNLLVVSR